MSENSDDNSPIEVAFVDEDELPINSVGWGYVQRLSDEEVDSDLVQTSSESESEDDVEPPARNIRARLQNDPANNQWKEDVVEHVDLNFVEHVGSKLQMDESNADNGYVLSYKVYTGKDNAAVACGLAKRVVLELAEPFFNKGYNIFMDNYYASVDPVKLEDQGTGGVMHSCSNITKTSAQKTYLFRSKCCTYIYK